MGRIAELIAHVAIHADVVEEVVPLENRVMLEHPVVCFRYEGLNVWGYEYYPQLGDPETEGSFSKYEPLLCRALPQDNLEDTECSVPLSP